MQLSSRSIPTPTMLVMWMTGAQLRATSSSLESQQFRGLVKSKQRLLRPQRRPNTLQDHMRRDSLSGYEIYLMSSGLTLNPILHCSTSTIKAPLILPRAHEVTSGRSTSTSHIISFVRRWRPKNCVSGTSRARRCWQMDSPRHCPVPDS